MNDTIIGIIGLGLMGESIADACVASGYRIVLREDRAERIEAFLAGHPATADRITIAEDVRELSSCSIVIEAIVEELGAKLALLGELDRVAPDAVIASNSSTFMPSELASSLQDPSRLLVLHFFNPANLVPLVEVVPGPQTDPAHTETVRRFAVTIGKTPVVLRREIEGFIANRIQAAVLREGYSLVETGVASPETVDTVVRLSLAPRWVACGPIATADLGGLDIFAALTARLFPRLDAGIETPGIVREHVDRGELGGKTGAGIYQWPPERRDAVKRDMADLFAFAAELAEAHGQAER